jgi:hypothetical protein
MFNNLLLINTLKGLRSDVWTRKGRSRKENVGVIEELLGKTCS